MFAPLLHCNRNCLSWSLLFDVSHNTRSDVLPRAVSTRAINIPLLLSSPNVAAVLHVATSRNARHSPGDNRGRGRGTGPKAKGNGTARFRIKLFSLSYPQRQPFCPGKRYSSGCSCYGEGWFPATVGCRPCIRLPLSLTEKEAMEERRKIRGFRSRWRESAEAFQVSLPFTRFMPRFVSGCL